MSVGSSSETASLAGYETVTNGWRRHASAKMPAIPSGEILARRLGQHLTFVIIPGFLQSVPSYHTLLMICLRPQRTKEIEDVVCCETNFLLFFNDFWHFERHQ
ncbi:hypothetical protein RB195_019356 [Necator americanus]|uniref:Uncharacterized protein n=1 Tax=Necator americanus TaxID=51031 RepID=A0ABR1CDR9_NECAM